MRNKNPLIMFVLVLLAFVALNWSNTLAQEESLEARSPTGTWDLRGVAEDGKGWIGTLVLTADPKGQLTGRVDWLGETGASGREFVTGTFDPRSSELHLEGHRLQYADSIARCRYTARLSAGGWELEAGTWTHLEPTVPGSWNARRLPLD